MLVLLAFINIYFLARMGYGDHNPYGSWDIGRPIDVGTPIFSTIVFSKKSEPQVLAF
jgi:hypothetical protein